MPTQFGSVGYRALSVSRVPVPLFHCRAHPTRSWPAPAHCAPQTIGDRFRPPPPRGTLKTGQCRTAIFGGALDKTTRGELVSKRHSLSCRNLKQMSSPTTLCNAQVPRYCVWWQCSDRNPIHATSPGGPSLIEFRTFLMLRCSKCRHWHLAAHGLKRLRNKCYHYVRSNLLIISKLVHLSVKDYQEPYCI